MAKPAPDALLAAVLHLLKAGRAADAAAAATHYVELQPLDPRAHALVARCATARGALDEAEAAIARALALQPDSLPALIELAQLARVRGDRARCAETLSRLCALQPGHAGFPLDLGASLMALGRPREAAAAFERALALAPDRVEALDGYARAISEGGGDAEQMLPPLQRALAHAPDSAQVWYRSALALRMVERYEQAHEALARALRLEPGLLAARWDEFQLPPAAVRGDDESERAFLGRWRRGLEWFERLDEREPAVRAQLEAAGALETDFHLHYRNEPFVDEQRRYARVVQRLAHRICAPLAPGRLAPSGRIRIGFVSAMFRRHSVAKVFGPLIAALPRERFELTLFHLDPRQDPATEALKARADHYFGGTRTLRDWHALIASRPLDVLVHVDIGLHGLSQYLAAYRFAPFQCALWGHPVTTGFAEIDAFLSADAMEPEDGERNYTETLVRLPRLGACFATPDVRADPGALAPHDDEPGTVRYLVAQTVYKLTPQHDDIYARIAAELPAARFHVLPHWRAEVCAALAARMRVGFERLGLDFDRHVRVQPRMSNPEFRALLARTHVNLDTIGFSGCVSTFEISAAGVPTVTLPLGLMRSRQSAAIMRRMGLDELCARDADEYVRIALTLGREPDLRAALARRIGERKHLLFDDTGVVDAFARAIEAGLAARR